MTKLRCQIGRCQRWLTSSGVWLIAMFFLTTQSAVELDHSDCLDCELFNRLPRSDVECANNNSDCGECYPGRHCPRFVDFVACVTIDCATVPNRFMSNCSQFQNRQRWTLDPFDVGYFPDPKDLYGICLELKMVSKSVNVPTDIGSGVYLPCRLNTEVNCTWTRDGKEVRIDYPNYGWDVGKGIDTRDCSIVINDLSETDAGSWVCSNGEDPMKPKDTVVSLTHEITVDPRPTYNVSAGQSVTIECAFRLPTKCLWYKDGREINETKDQFTFNKIPTGCSLTIHSFNPNDDQGNWTCYIRKDLYPEDTILSRTILVRGYEENHSENVTSVDHSANVASFDHSANVTSVDHSAIVASVDHSAIVTSVNHNEKTSVSGAPPSVQTLSSLHSSYPFLMVNVYIIDCLVIGAIGFLFYYYCIKRKRHAEKSKNTWPARSTKSFN